MYYRNAHDLEKIARYLGYSELIHNSMKFECTTHDAGAWAKIVNGLIGKPHTAGIVIHEFPYPEHVADALPRISEHLKVNMAKALVSTESTGPVNLKAYRFEDDHLPATIFGKPMPFDQLMTRWTLAGTIKGGFVTVRLEDFPAAAVSVWGAATRDLIELIRVVIKKYKVQEGGSPALQSVTGT